MLNIRNQLDKIIITAMDRFVWFVLLVVFSHLVTEFTRVTGYTRGSRHDAVMANDSSIRPIRVQNQIQFPGQEYGQYVQRNPPYYSDNSQYNNYENNAAIRTKPTPSPNIFSNMFNVLFNQNNAASNNNNNFNPSNNNNGPEFSPTNPNIDGPEKGNIRAFGLVQPIIDSIFDIPISTLKAVNNLVGRLTGGYQLQQQQQQYYPNYNVQPQPQQQQQSFFSSFPSFPSFPALPSFPAFSSSPPASPPSSSAAAASLPSSQPSYYGMQKSVTTQPKAEVEMLKRLRQIGSSISNININNNNNKNNQQQQPQQQQPLQSPNVASI